MFAKMLGWTFPTSRMDRNKTLFSAKMIYNTLEGVVLSKHEFELCHFEHCHEKLKDKPRWMQRRLENSKKNSIHSTHKQNVLCLYVSTGFVRFEQKGIFAKVEGCCFRGKSDRQVVKTVLKISMNFQSLSGMPLSTRSLASEFEFLMHFQDSRSNFRWSRSLLANEGVRSLVFFRTN